MQLRYGTGKGTGGLRGGGFGFDIISTVDAFAEAMGRVSRTGVNTIDTEKAHDTQVLILEPANQK